MCKFLFEAADGISHAVFLNAADTAADLAGNKGDQASDFIGGRALKRYDLSLQRLDLLLHAVELNAAAHLHLVHVLCTVVQAGQIEGERFVDDGLKVFPGGLPIQALLQVAVRLILGEVLAEPHQIAW